VSAIQEQNVTESTLIKKLKLKTGMRALILNSPAVYIEMLGELPGGVIIDDRIDGIYDFVHLFVRSQEELDRFEDQAIRAVRDDGLLWISYPKGGSKVKTDLNRDKLWEALSGKVIRPVSMISIDEVWSAMRFRPIDAVGG
jgi:hypothetical protein